MPSEPTHVVLMTDWSEWEAKLSAADPDSIDDVVDGLAACVLDGAPNVLAGPVLVRAAFVVRSDLSQSRLASAFAWAGDPDDAATVDCLANLFRSHKGNPFLGSTYLGALGLLALRGFLARTETLGLLSRLRLTDNRFVLVCGAKVIGLLDDRQPDQGLQSKLRELASSPLPPVNAEARYQLALVAFREALRAENESDLLGRLAHARDAFRLAEVSEEIRPDAALLAGLLDVTLDVAGLGLDPHGASTRIQGGVVKLRRFLGSKAQTPTAGYRSDAAVRLTNSVVGIAEAAERACEAAAEAQRWVDLKPPFVLLADSYLAIRTSAIGIPGHDAIETALRSIADRALAPQLGPVLRLWVGRVRLAEVVRRYEAEHGQTDTYRALRLLESLANTDAPETVLDADAEAQLASVSVLLKVPPAEFIRSLADTARTDGVERLATSLGLRKGAAAQRLQPAQLEGLWAGVLSSFDRSALTQTLRMKMGVKLDDIVSQVGFRDQVFQLIEWAETNGRAHELARVALEAKPLCGELQACVATLGINAL